jgi:DNA-binding GntR family transcriptional regulator
MGYLGAVVLPADVTNPPRADHVLRHTRERILTGQVEPGTYLRLEHLAEEHGVSVTPVREAMMQLRTEGFVEWQPRRGFVVLPFDADDIRDIYRVQAFVAADLAQRAAHRLSPHDIDTLEDVQARLEAADRNRDFAVVEQLNHEFHRRINLAASSPRMAGLLRTLAQFAPSLFFAEIEGWVAASASEHRGVLTALREGDADAVATRMADHIAHAGELLAQHVEATARVDR